MIDISSVNILAVGDICGQAGIDIISSKLRGIKNLYDIKFTVINGENAGGLGVSPAQAEAVFQAAGRIVSLTTVI